eukprot:c27329_g1_i1.p1 GENE.c27329_g1_i1~~c27329_g1_i1.p1  ORF type:complete len:263 (+),score=117.68 c27329_g1_i1:48-836(+)
MTSNNHNFTGQTALITGAGKGIGKAITLLLISRGAKVIGVARTEADLQEIQAQVGKENFDYVSGDLSQPTDCVRVAQEALKKGNITLLVNNAGIAFTQSFLEVDLESWQSTFAVNVTAVMIISQQIARHIVATGQSGKIVNISSTPSGYFGTPNRAAYCSSKGALNQLTRVMALELGQKQIRTNSVAPCPTMTEMGKNAWGDKAKSAPVLGKIPMQRFPEPEEVAEAVIWLLSDSSSMINGQIICVDGGMTSTGLTCVPLKD